jgi:hypothetical protein
MSQPRGYESRAGARTKRKEASLFIDVAALMRLTGLARSTTTAEVKDEHLKPVLWSLRKMRFTRREVLSGSARVRPREVRELMCGRLSVPGNCARTIERSPDVSSVAFQLGR